MQYKNIGLEQAQIKSAGDGYRFSGYASVFNSVDAYGDTILPGAYKATLTDRNRPIRMRWNHFDRVVGKWIDMKEDEVGLFVEGELTKGHSLAEDVKASIAHGAVDGMSIGYRVKDYEMEGEIRLLKQIELVEISVVEEPADLGAKIRDVKQAVEMIERCDSLKEIEEFLRDSGYSKKAATALVSRVRKLGDPADPLSDFQKAIQRIRV